MSGREPRCSGLQSTAFWFWKAPRCKRPQGLSYPLHILGLLTLDRGSLFPKVKVQLLWLG